MNFDLTEEQSMLVDSVQRFVSDNYSLDQRQAYIRGKGGFSSDNWQTMAELGWLAMSLPEEVGGFGGNQLETMLLMEQFGKGLVAEPYLSTVVLGADLIANAAQDPIKNELLAELAAGNTHLSLAFAEAQARFDMHDVTTRATACDGGYELSGHKAVVMQAGTADYLIVSARTAGGDRDVRGITLFLVDKNGDGLQVSAAPIVDGQHAGEVKLDGVIVPETHVLGSIDEGFALLQMAQMNGILALCAEAVGAMEVLYKDTVEYIQEREQFGHPLAQFQVLKHRVVDMFMDYEQAKSLLYRATLEVTQTGLGAMKTVHALKHFVGKVGIEMGEQAVQSHGGMGMTEELRLGHYFKRLLVLDTQFGNSDYHLEQFCDFEQAASSS